MLKGLSRHLAAVCWTLCLLLLVLLWRSNRYADDIACQTSVARWEFYSESGLLWMGRWRTPPGQPGLRYDNTPLYWSPVPAHRLLVHDSDASYWRVGVSIWLVIGAFLIMAIAARMLWGRSPGRWGRYPLPFLWATLMILWHVIDPHGYFEFDMFDQVIVVIVSAVPAVTVLVWYDELARRPDGRPPIWRWHRRRRFQRVRHGCCGECGYDLRASGDRCSECGAPRMHLRDFNPAAAVR